MPADEIVRVRSRIPGSVATGTCSAPSKVRCSYTSSVTTHASCSRASAQTSSSSARVNTFPVGLCGVFSSTRRVRDENAARSDSSSTAKSGKRSTDVRRTPPASAIVAAYES